jgi:plastocyanin
MGRHLLRAGVLSVALALAAAACGGGDDNGNPAGPSGGGTPGPVAATITITTSGVSPNNITVAPGSRVTFTNNDNRAHTMNSDPHPTHGDCPGLDDVSFIATGTSRTSGNLNAVRTCTYHDHNEPDNRALQGTIRVQ